MQKFRDVARGAWPSSSGNGQSTTMASFFQLLSGTLGLRLAESVFASDLAKKPAQARTGGAGCDREREPDGVAEGAIAAIRRLFVSGHVCCLILEKGAEDRVLGHWWACR
jgi:hypothetical protein